jgi:predicted ribosome quality control (RQC) complex YloA/Tae2 family protein
LSVSGRNNLYAYAKEFGIREEQIIVKEYTTQQTQNNEAVFKGIYERLDSQIEEYEKTIDQLKAELAVAKQSQLPYTQLANEISANYPEIKHICIGQGAQIDIDSLKTTPCIIVKVKTDTLLPDSSLEQLTKWLKVRLQTETIEIDNTTNRL